MIFHEEDCCNCDLNSSTDELAKVNSCLLLLSAQSLRKQVSPIPNSSPSTKVCNNGFSIVSGKSSFVHQYTVRMVQFNASYFFKEFITEKMPAIKAATPNSVKGIFGSSESFNCMK